MSRNSIKAVDLYCSVANWNDSLENAYPDEIKRWTAQRDRKLAAFRKAMAKVTLDGFLSGRWGSYPMHRRLAQWADMQAMAAGRPFCELPHPVLPPARVGRRLSGFQIPTLTSETLVAQRLVRVSRVTRVN
jgi:hypothetical protein